MMIQHSITTDVSEKIEKAAAPVRDISCKTTRWGAALVCLMSLWIRSGIPLVAVPVGYHDSGFFARTANYLLAGQWLGPYDKMTLAKGMFYPLFVAAASAASIPLKVAEQLAYLSAAGIASFVASRASQRRWFGLLMFVGLAFNPVLWNHWLALVARESLYTALSLALLGLLVLICFPELHRPQRSIALGVSFGLVWAAFWLTREESIWLLPACLVPILVGIANSVISRRKSSGPSLGVTNLLGQLRPVLVPLAVGTAVFFIGLGLVSGMNWRYYGVFRTSEVRSGAFVRAYGALARIQGSSFRRYVPVAQDVRKKAYEVSGAARELSTSLEGRQGQAWADLDCSVHPIPSPCDLQSGVLMWALRDAAEQAGHYRSAQEAELFYSTMADQTNHACHTRRIACSARRDTFTPPFRWEYVAETAQTAKGIAKLIFDMGNGEVGAVPSVGSAQGLANFADLTDEYISPPVGGIVQDLPLGQVSGWVADRDSMPVLQVTPYTKREVKSTIILAPSPDVVAVHPDLKSVRFTLQSTCPVMECDLEIHSSTGNVQVPFHKLVRGAPINTPNLILFIDRATADEEKWPISERRHAIQMRIAHRVGKLYAKSSRFVTVLATIGILVAIGRFRYRRPSLPLLVLAIGSMAAVASRILLLSYIDATAFSAYYLHYCSPASPFLIIFVVSGIYMGWSSLFRQGVSEINLLDSFWVHP
jgi:hypothetical protein